MEIILFIYNIVITIATSLAVACSYYLYKRTNETILIFVGSLFGTYIFDNIIIFMTEFIESFADNYTNIFISSPVFKTIIYFIYIFCYYNFCTYILSRKILKTGYFILILYAVFLMVEPVLLQGKWSALFFYHATQILNICLLVTTIVKLKNATQDDLKFNYQKYKKLLYIALVFNVMIMVEDSYVILNIDEYTSFNATIHYRSFSENVMFLTFAWLFIKFSTSYFRNEIETAQTPNIEIASGASDVNNTKHLSDLFCDNYGFTEREKEIFIELVEEKNIQCIADELFISTGTVKAHIHNIYQKADVAKRNILIHKYEEFVANRTTKQTVSNF